MAKREYPTEGLTVHWDSTKCIHSSRCLHALPEVFDTRKRPWVNVSGADAPAIAQAVNRCPSGALTFSSDELEEPLPTTPRIRAIKSGPLVVRGQVEVIDDDGNVIRCDGRMTFCRCGQSANQPFCDTSHRAADFADERREQTATDDAEGADERQSVPMEAVHEMDIRP